MVNDMSRHEFFSEVNFAMELYNFCKTFHVLPKPGGLFEQDAYHMELLDAVISAVGKKTDREMAEAKRKGAR
jgi:hypothetical protein